MSATIEALCTEGKGRFPCPSCGAVASDQFAYPYCPNGCTEARVLVALGSRPSRCERDHGSPHGRDPMGKCLTCQVEIEWTRSEARRVVETTSEQIDVSSMRVSGGYLFDLPTDAPIWGTPDELLAAEGQSWMIVGPDGTGKTSCACQYVKARLGLAQEMWELPVAPLPEDQSVYYLAMDRPRQMMEAFMRGVNPDLREVIDCRLNVHRGPPPYRLGRPSGHEWLVREVEETNAGLVVFDSRKDVGNTLDSEDVLGVATAVQLLVAADVEVLILAHPTKARRNGPPLLEHVSGHREVFSGLGSVLFLDGRPGDSMVTVHHVKPIRERVKPFKIAHDHTAGFSERLGEGIVLGPETGDLIEGRSPSDRWEVRVLQTIDAHTAGEAPASSLKDVLQSQNLTRDLRGLVTRKVIEQNGKRGAQSGYRRGPAAPPRQ